MKTPQTKTAPRLNLSLPDQRQSANSNQPPSQSQSHTYSGFDPVANLENLVIPEIDDDHEDVDAPVNLADQAAQLEAVPPDTMDKDAFWIVFKTVFVIPSFAIPDLKSLAIQPEEEYAARGASDATHSLLEIYYPNALMPQGEVFGHLMIAAPFFFAKAMIVREVIRARRAKPANRPEPPRSAQQPEQKPEPPKATNENWPLDFDAIEIPAAAAA